MLPSTALLIWPRPLLPTTRRSISIWSTASTSISFGLPLKTKYSTFILCWSHNSEARARILAALSSSAFTTESLIPDVANKTKATSDMEATNGSNETAVQATARDKKTMGDGEDTTEENSTMKVWIAVDESDGSFYALEWALKHLFAHHDADKESPFAITVVHVQPPFQPTYTALPVGPVLFATSGMRDSLVKAEEESAAKILARASELCDQLKIKVEYLVLRGNPKEMLVEAVDQMDIDLLVVGSRGLGQIKRAVLGSISDYCAHHAKCPVLIVRPMKA